MASEMTMSELFLNILKDIGFEMVEYINRIKGSEEKQYMVAYLVTDEELYSGNTKPLYNIQAQFRRLIETRVVPISDRYFQFDRFIFLMNLYDKNGKSYQHTEKRLLDGKGTISDSETSLTEDGEFLAKLKSDFKRKIGDKHPYNMLIFSFYIPCTQENHQCAKLIRKYADKTGCKITIGWTMNYRTTDVEESLDLMKSENVTVMKLSGTPQTQRGSIRIHPLMTDIQAYHRLSCLGEQDVNMRYRNSSYTEHGQLRHYNAFYFINYQRNYDNFPQNFQMYCYPVTQNRTRF